ncbi:GNAT family N-acetyltransferase [Schumannella sp. 10F1B-5-1]|uniref:GNAT family N-acetyltransferase n=1 Tax=Schumannella sp. 10F1B-5-1 TaxID=2590780 RepID=UPI0015E85D87|nr:GNAT family N-acetyltransferase [Schumannella sp. 10F1B-5-1]
MTPATPADPSTTTPPAGLEIVELSIPETLDAPGGDDFRAAVEIWNAIELESFGPAADRRAAEESLPSWRNQRWERRRMLLAKLDGRVVGRGAAHSPVSSPETAFVHVSVVEDARRQGIGAALADRLEHLRARRRRHEDAGLGGDADRRR